jgi:hypothetical protein
VKNFAITGVAGFVAPRHLEAIHATGNRLVAAVDPHDSVGILDRYAFDVRFFTEISVSTILQLRLHPALIALKARIDNSDGHTATASTSRT